MASHYTDTPGNGRVMKAMLGDIVIKAGYVCTYTRSGAMDFGDIPMDFAPPARFKNFRPQPL